MEQLLTGNVATNLYWFGRYLERIESLLLEVVPAFDTVIDIDKDYGKKLYKRLEIDIDYKTPKEFLKVALFSDHVANINTLMEFVRENAIICRADMYTSAFGTVMELSDLIKKEKNTSQVEFKFIDKVLALISEIWGELTRREKRNTSDYFIRLGKLVEKVDSHLILERNKNFSLIVMDEIDMIASILSPDAEFKPHDENDSYEVILDSINGKIHKIIIE